MTSWLANWIGQCNFLQTTTIHPLGRLNKHNPLKVNLLWVCVSLLTLSLSVYQISREARKMTVSKYTVNMRFANRHEIVYPLLTCCMNHWALWVNFSRAYDEFNLTKMELLTLVAPFNNEFHAEKCPEPTKVKSLMQSALGKLGLPTSDQEPIQLEAIFLKLSHKTVLFDHHQSLRHKGVFVFHTSRSESHLEVCVQGKIDWIGKDESKLNSMAYYVS